MSSENTESSINSAINGANGAQAQSAPEAAPADHLAEAQAKLAEVQNKYLYLYSDFENFRRRAEVARADAIKFGQEGFLRDLLQVLDNFERGIQHAKSFGTEKGSPLGQILQGLEMIHHQYLDALKNQGVTEIKSLGEKFNPAFHEAISEEESETAEAGTILKEHSRGYLLHGRLLRAARVVTAKKQA